MDVRPNSSSSSTPHDVGTSRLPPRPPVSTRMNDGGGVGGISLSTIGGIKEEEEENGACKTFLEDVHNAESIEHQKKYWKGESPSWDDFFDTCEDIQFDIEGGKKETFRAYTGGDAGPVLFCLHGGGHTAMSFALVAQELRRSMRVVAYDSRGHGQTKSEDEKEDENFSAEKLVEDALQIIQYFSNKIKQNNKGTLPSVILVGHSMGGAIATRTAASGRVENLQGLVVLDVVEGTAMEALPGMVGVINKIPKEFASVNECVLWALKANLLRNKISAQISVPSQLIQKNDHLWVWRCDLYKTQAYWEGWFRGLSKLFLSAKCVKVLVLAGQDRLDKALMIAHMQGKFQLHIIPQSGHVIEEDEPGQVVKLLLEFVHRYKLN